MTAPGDDVVLVDRISKRYHIYDRPQDRLWQGVFRGRRQFYRDFWALHEVSCEVRRGETVGIIGHNGSGKSTLLQIVCGTLTPTTGTVTVRGRLAGLLELGSGFNPEFTGRENVYMNGAILGLPRAAVDERFDDIAAFADIGPFIDQPVKTYSSGMVVRLAFSVIAHVDADLLVIDEALAVGDALFTQKCMRFLRRFQQRGSILFVSHDTNAVLNLCQRALWLDHGRCVEVGVAKAVVQAYMRANIEAAQRAVDAAPQLPVEPGASQAAASAPNAAPSEEPRDALFDPDALSFGAMGARIQTVELFDSSGRASTSFTGGEHVTLRIRFTALQDLSSAIVGFNLKDRLGQVLFGENTYLTTRAAPVAVRAGEMGTAVFSFAMPALKTGQYLLDVAVAEGTQEEHVQHQWLFDVLVVHVMTTRSVFGVFVLDTSVSLTVGPSA